MQTQHAVAKQGPALACLWSLAAGSSGRLAARFLCCSFSFAVRRFSSSSCSACAERMDRSCPD